jgi:hypothetical protein
MYHVVLYVKLYHGTEENIIIISFICFFLINKLINFITHTLTHSLCGSHNIKGMSHISPRFPITYEDLKQELRNGLKSTASRAYWWPILTDISPTEMYTAYPDVTAAAERLCTMMKEPLLDYKTQASYASDKNIDFVVNQTKNLMYVLRNNKKIESAEVPYFEVMVRLITHVIRRIDVTYMLLGSMLNNRDK